MTTTQIGHTRDVANRIVIALPIECKRCHLLENNIKRTNSPNLSFSNGIYIKYIKHIY